MVTRHVRPLTPTQQAILEALAEGQTREEIAQERGIHYKTVEEHLQAVYRQLGARSGPHAVALAYRQRILE